MKSYKKFALSSSVIMAMTLTPLFSNNLHLITDVEAAKTENTVKVDKTEKDVLFYNSFEEKEVDGFLDSQLDEGKGMSNVSGVKAHTLVGDITRLIDKESIKGSKDYKDNESKSNLFDKKLATKYLTSENNGKDVWVSFKLKESKVVHSYVIASANDAKERDPKKWTLYGSNDEQEWEKIDSRTNEKFENRLEEKTFTFDNNKAYIYYKLVIEENNGDNMTQFSEFNLATGNEADDEKLENQNMQTKLSTGPSVTWNQQANVGWSGKQALEVSGSQIKEGKGYAYNTIYDVNIPVDGNTHLSYVIFPSVAENGKYDYSYTSMHISLDLKFTDGTYLSDLDSIDQNGNIVSPEKQGDSRTLTFNQWNKITTEIGNVAKGKTIDKILVGYQDSDKKAANSFLAYIDDIEVSNYEEKFYDRKSDYVNILRGTNDSGSFSRGLTVPAVTVPHGFNFWAPVTNSGSNTLYDYQLNGDEKFQHMTVSHEPSIWVGDRGTWQYMVNSSIDINNVKSGSDIANSKVASSFSHDNETAKAHYYSVEFDKNSPASGTKLEVTPSEHGSINRFTFSKDVKYRNIIFDSVRANGSLTMEKDNKSFSAYTDHTGNGMKRMYIYGQFNKEFKQSNVQNKKQGIVSFADDVNEIEMKVATSFISPEQAKKNLELELSNQNFDSLFGKTQDIWDKELDIIEVEGASKSQLVTLYSNLYRLLAYPNNYSENTGTNENPIWKYCSPYSGSNDNPSIVEGKLYVNNGFWDTYRTAWSAYSLLTPSKYNEMLDGLVQHYNDNTWVPRWIAPGGTNSMVGTSSDIIFGDAIMKGAHFDAEGAYKSAIKNASVVSNNLTGGGRNKLEVSNFLGYVPSDLDSHGFSWSIEGYINDFGISQMAEKLGHKDEAKYYRNRALNYSKLFDKQGTALDSWLKGKQTNGQWSTDPSEFNPISWKNDYTETDAYNMAVSVPQDGQGLANLYGGKEGLGKKIDSIINTPGDFENDRSIIHEMLEAREVKLGQYGQSNQPAHHILYMYNHAGQPWKTQKYVRDVLHRLYVGSDFGQGYIGDEDNGEMSAWYIFSALGFYPLNLGSNEYAIGSPLFTKATVHLENGKDLIVNAPKNSKENVYVQSVKLNGKDHTKNFFTHEEISKGATINFEMGDKPNKAWGSSDEALPTSITKDKEDPNPIDDMTKASVNVANEDNSDSQNVMITNIKDAKKLVDNTSASNTTIDNQSLIYKFKRPQKVEMYTITSAQENTKFNHVELLGSNDGENWVSIDNRKDLVFEWKQYTRPFAIDESMQKEFSYYKLNFEGQGKVAEIELLGNIDDEITKEDLAFILNQAKQIDQTNFNESLKNLLNQAIEEGQKVYEDSKSTSVEYAAAYNKLEYAINTVTTIQSAYKRIEAENYSTKHPSIVNDGNNIGGVQRDTWTKYDFINFEDFSPNYFEINYSGQPSDTAKDANIEVYLDSFDSEPVFTIQTPPTTGWSDYKTISLNLTKEQSNKLTGMHDVLLKFKGSEKTYVANVDWFRFAKKININVTSQGNGTITPTGKIVKEAKESVEFTLTPDHGYVPDSVDINGEIHVLDPSTNKYVLTNMKEDTQVKFGFKKENIDEIPVDSITIKTNALTILKKGKTLKLETAIQPSNATDKTVKWKVENPKIVEVLEDGTLKGLSTGITKVIAETNNGKKASFTVRVTQ